MLLTRGTSTPLENALMPTCGILIVLNLGGLEPIRKDWIHDEAFVASRLSMMRIMARRMKAVTVVA
jgi:hypothetical protein